MSASRVLESIQSLGGVYCTRRVVKLNLGIFRYLLLRVRRVRLFLSNPPVG